MSFFEAFKFYKRKSPIPDLSSVVDTRDPEFNELLQSFNKQERKLPACFGLRSPETWKISEFKNHPGLIIIENPFTSQGERYWVTRCLRDFPKHPNRTNLNTHKLPEDARKDFWSFLGNVQCGKEHKKLRSCLRWSTLGYHHDWDTKVYSETEKHPFPEDLSALTIFLGEILSFRDFKAEAAIVNFYPQGSTLAGHTDHSEIDLKAPLFSISFGQGAIFLIGGYSKEDPATPIRLHSGDILIMSGASRLCYHAVPLILHGCLDTWNDDSSFSEDPKSAEMDKDVWNKCIDESFWTPFNQYISDCRINLNIRQVLSEGLTNL
ncbi:AlkB [Sergentomyia squamirostris]